MLWGEPGGLSVRNTGESGRFCVVFTVIGLDFRGVVATGGGVLVSVEPSPMLVADCSAARFRGFVGGMLTDFFWVFGCTQMLVIFISSGDGVGRTGLCGGAGRGDECVMSARVIKKCQLCSKIASIFIIVNLYG